MSTSKQLRIQGNEIYLNLHTATASCVKETRLLKCLNLYQQAINVANSSDDACSAYKNHALVSFDLFKYFNQLVIKCFELLYL